MIRSILRFILWLVCGPQVMLVCIGVGFAVYMIGGECALLECPPHRTAAAALSVNPAVRHYYQNAPGVALLCGLPAAPAAFAHGIVTQKYRGCQITGRYSVRSNIPTSTVTPIPSPTSPAPTSMPLPTAAPVPSPTPECWADYDRCLLSLINGVRAQHGYQPLALSAQQSPRSQQHAQDMEISGSIWHVNALYPAASFPATIYCYPFCASAENVGEAASSSEAAAVQADLDQMLSEPWSPGCLGNHACSLLSPSYHGIGIGISYSGNVVFVVQDFVA